VHGNFSIALLLGGKKWIKGQTASDLCRKFVDEEAAEVIRKSDTSGGSHIEGDVVTGGGDFVGRDKVIYRDRRRPEDEFNSHLSRAVNKYELEIQAGVAPAPDPNDRPYKGLYPFDVGDTDIFFGRYADSQRLYHAVQGPLTVLHAKSGTGKTSLINAGLSPLLIRERCLPIYVRVYYDPVDEVKGAIAPPLLGSLRELLSRLTLGEFLKLTCDRLTHHKKGLVVILDQFEEFFIHGPEREYRQRFVDALADCCEDRNLPVSFLISIRSDYFSHLAIFQNRLPSIFHNQCYLEAVTREGAREAISGPVKRRGQPVEYDPALIDALLDDLIRFDDLKPGEVELPHLQIICSQLYDEVVTRGETIITLASYRDLERADGILGRYLSSTLDKLPGKSKSIGQEILKELVGSESISRRLSLHTLAARIGVERQEAEGVLAQLVNARLLRRDEDEKGGEPAFQVVHEYLLGEIMTWIDPAEQKSKQMEEMLMREVASWRVHGTLIPKDRLELLYPYRQTFKGLTNDAWKCILSSALEVGFEILDWAKLAGEVGRNFLLAKLDHPREEIRRIVVEALGEYWELLEVSQLGDDKASVRQSAAKKLGEMGDRRALKPLSSAALHDRESGVRSAAVEALAKLRDPNTVKSLCAALDDKSSEVRQMALKGLVTLGEVAVNPLIDALRKGNSLAADGLVGIGAPAVTPLIDTLRDRDPYLRQSAARVLGRLHDDRALKPLSEALNDKDSHVRHAAVEALAKLGNPGAIKLLGAALQDPDRSIRQEAISGLVDLGGPQAVEQLRTILYDEDIDIRRAVVAAAARLGKPAIPLLSSALQDEDGSIRLASVNGLAPLGEHSVEPLIDALQNSDSRVRQAAAEALGRTRDSRAVKPLIDVLQDKSPHLSKVRQSAATALGEIGGLRAVEPLVDALRDEAWNVVQAVAEALGKLGDQRAVKPLSVALSDGDANIRRVAAKALGELGCSDVVEPLIAALGDKDTGVSQVAAEGLVKLGTSSIEPLIGALKSKNRNVRKVAIGALVQLGEPAVKPLAATLQDKNRNAREAAAAGLVELGKASIEPLCDVLKDKDAGRAARQLAARALGQLRSDRAVKLLVTALEDSNIRREAREALVLIGDPAVRDLKTALQDKRSRVRKEVKKVLEGIDTPDALAALEKRR
jgi:HEAT repeat protein